MEDRTFIGIPADRGVTARYLHGGDSPQVLVPTLRAIWTGLDRNRHRLAQELLAEDWSRLTAGQHPSSLARSCPASDGRPGAVPAPVSEPGPGGDAEPAMTVCTVRGAIDELAHHKVPSTAGGGHDTCTICQRCGSSVTTDPMFDAHVTRNPWPPEQASTP